MRPLINYLGGKWNDAEWITSHFPEHEIYVEVFGGSAAVLLKKPRTNREIINDIDDEIVNLYKVVRDHGKELKRLCSLTPHSRIEYERAREFSIDPIERARRTIVKSYFGIGDSLSSRNGFRNSTKINTCVASSWKSWWVQALELTERFQCVTLECLDFTDLISKYDSPTTLFYLDPPYVMKTRNQKHGYKHDFTEADHDRLLHTIQGLKGFTILSGYNSETYQKLKWRRVERTSQTQVGSATECLWLCPRTVRSEKQLTLFSESNHPLVPSASDEPFPAKS